MPTTLKIRVLLDIEEDVFRDFEIATTDSFETLHLLIQEHFGFDNGQMASFYMSNDNWDKGEEVTLMDMSMDGEQSKVSIMKDTPIGNYLTAANQRMVYVFDFLLMWCFFVEVVEVSEADAAQQLPVLVQSYGDAPDQYSKEPDFGLDGLDFEDDNASSESKDPSDIFEDFDDFDQYV